MIKKVFSLSLGGLLSLAASAALAGSLVGSEPPPSTCGDRFAWPDDLAAHVLAGPLDGSFDYDFPGAAIDEISGAYAAGQQAASWEVVYASDHYLVGASVEDTDAVVSLDGDLSVRETTTTTDSLGQVWVETVERERTGCVEQRVIDPDGLALSHAGQWSAGRYDYSEQRPLANNRALTSLVADVVGALHEDGSAEATAVYFNEGQEASTTITITEQRNLDGERWIDMSLTSLDASRSASTYIAADGTATKTGHYGYDTRWDYGTTLDYSGVGTGWLYSSDAERYCYLDIDETCTRSCWTFDALDELQSELEDEEVEWELELGEYVVGRPPTVDNYCNAVLFENYAITPF